MLRLIRSANNTIPSSTARQARPVLERLEERDCPSTVPVNPNVTFNLTYGPNQTVTVYGQLTGAPNNANQSILLMGTLNGQGTTDANGDYSITLKAMMLGGFTVSANNPQTNQMEAQAQGNLTDKGPVITNFKGVEDGNEEIFTGKVTDNWDPAGWVVHFGGDQRMQGLTATVQDDGTFELVLTMPPGADSFVANAQLTDCWGTKSNLAQYLVNVT